ncbi:hypothetical protein SCALIN_C05_0111 [Candidatus Scalindua japonica]|uniref:Uncharacterized protein n=2 Tax=Candidatus Scalindua japonica TaxID=1284222 RepID=A0A286TVU2_9BACT|nr:hypothetical protein SCALIN_C05_0111 [Candidatus Scalindua japonica]
MHHKVDAGTGCSKGSKENIALADLVTIFNEEAYNICKNRQIAKLIALKSLQEYIKKNTKDLKIIL